MSRRRPRQPPPPSFPPRWLTAALRRRSTKWLIAAIATLALGLTLGVIADRTGGEDARPVATATLPAATQPTALSATAAAAQTGIAPDATRLQSAEVARVIDGDTIEVRLGGTVERVRYYGVDTPERGDRCYEEARDRNAALAGERVLLLPDARERDPFDRLLRYAFDEEGRSIDAQLIAEGLALAWREDGAYRDALVALEEEARGTSTGCLWSD